MKASQILGTEVRDAHGTTVGRLHDLRLVQDGPPTGSFGAGLHICGLLVGPSGWASRLGFDRRGVSSPWLIAAIAHRLARDVRFVPWCDVDRFAPDLITLTCLAGDLEAPAPLPFRPSGAP